MKRFSDDAPFTKMATAHDHTIRSGALPGLGASPSKAMSFLDQLVNSTATPESKRNAIYQRQRKLKRELEEIKPKQEAIRKLKQAHDALMRYLTDDEKSFGPMSGKITDMRRAVQRTIPLLRTEGLRFNHGSSCDLSHDDMLDKWMSAHWIDFRHIGAHDESMAGMGKEIFEAGIIALPFPECVFVIARDTSDMRSVPVAVHVAQRDRELIVQDAFCIVDHPIAAYIRFSDNYGKVQAQLDEVQIGFLAKAFHGLAVMNTKYFVRERATLSGQAERRAIANNPATHYWTVKIKARYAEALKLGGSHASPRLHWRRGHVRRYGTGTQAWVRPHLVGSVEGGVILHDYEARPDRAND